MGPVLKFELDCSSPCTLRVEGEIDSSTTDELRKALDDARGVDPKVRVDLTGVTFVSAAGLRVFLEVADSLNGDGPLTLLHAPLVARLLDLVGMSDVTSIAIQDEG